MGDRFIKPRDAAMALLNAEMPLTRRAGSFLGQLVVDPTPMSEKQRDWLTTLLERADLPSFDEEAGA